MARRSSIDFDDMREFQSNPGFRTAEAWAERLGVSRRRVQQLARAMDKACKRVPPGPPPSRSGNCSRYW